jgi:hypothetical protein
MGAGKYFGNAIKDNQVQYKHKALRNVVIALVQVSGMCLLAMAIRFNIEAPTAN